MESNVELKTAIITYIDKNYEENLELDFLKSLFIVAKFRGKVIVLDYGMSERTRCKIKKEYGDAVEIHPCQPRPSIFSARYRDIKEVIERLDNDVEVVITADGGDIWFQERLAPLISGYVERIGLAHEERQWGIDDWTKACLECMEKNKREQVMSVLQGTNVYNSGVIIGNKNMMKGFFERVYDHILTYGHEFFGIDQMFADYEYALLEEREKNDLNDIYNFVVVSNKNKYFLKNEEVYREDGCKVVIVHNAGGNWRMLKRPFQNAYKNEEQYHIQDKYLFMDEIGAKGGEACS